MRLAERTPAALECNARVQLAASVSKVLFLGDERAVDDVAKRGITRRKQFIDEIETRYLLW
jgi:hypothetical protein